MSQMHVDHPAAMFVTGDDLAEDAVGLVAKWLREAEGIADHHERKLAERLAELIDDPESVAFTMRFIDRVARPESDPAAAHQLTTLEHDHPLPDYLSPIDRVLLRIGARIAPRMPKVVLPIARRRMRSLVGHMVADADPDKLTEHLAGWRDRGYAMNVNLLGEAILGEREALRRFESTLRMLERPDVDYVSVKISSVASQLDLWAFDVTLERIVERLRTLYTAAMEADPPKFVNLDMEEYKDLDLTIAAFTRLLDEFPKLDAGLVLQAYMPDAFHALEHLVAWSTQRHQRGGGTIKIRLVKGANLAMERVEAEIHGWEQAPYTLKHETDANFKRCIDWALRPEHLDGVRIGIGSHNLFDIAWTHLLAEARGVSDMVEFEMLQGMAPAHSEVVYDDTGSMLLYTPVVRAEDFDVAIGYLFRRLEENAGPENFLRSLLSLRPGTPEFDDQAKAFSSSVADRWNVSDTPRRTQDRTMAPPSRPLDLPFDNEPDTDPALTANREWAREVIAAKPEPIRAPEVSDEAGIDAVIETARRGADEWALVPAAERRRLLMAVGDELARRRGELISAMVHEGTKTVAEADPEVSEAIDFARYYGDRALELEDVTGARFEPLGVMAVIPPWNFPVAIPAGGVLAALAAGNAVVFKPSRETPRCGEIVAEACWAAGIPSAALQFLRITDREVGRHLVTHPNVDGVILTGSWDTAQRFRSWKTDLKLFGETSGKNSLIITPHADLDLAAADLVRSAFGHSGQKCSAASLGILVGEVYDSPRFRKQLIDATETMALGVTSELGTVLGPIIRPADGALAKALSSTEPGESWLLAPRRMDDEGRLWAPGIRDGVEPGSWFHTTECFGPVLGLIRARDLDHAIEIQNSSKFGLTGGIHTLDPHEIQQWTDTVEVGNAYINRKITGAIVRRQPFGGWKRSVVGPGAKAGGPNYVMQLGTWYPDGSPREGEGPRGPARELLQRVRPALQPDDQVWLQAAAASDEWWWDHEYSRQHDPSGLVAETNVFRYRPRPTVVVRAGADAADRDVARALLAAARAGIDLEVSAARTPHLPLDVPTTVEDDVALVGRLDPQSRIRVVGAFDPEARRFANDREIEVLELPVTGSGRIELQWYLREQAISRTVHRFGNLIGAEL